MSEPDGGVRTLTRVSVPRSLDDLTFEWVGGPVARIRSEFGRTLGFDPYGVFSNPEPQVGDIMRYGSFTVRCIARTSNYVDLERLHGD